MFSLEWSFIESLMLRGSDVILNQTLFSPVFLAAVLFIWSCEKRFPVDPEQGTFSTGLRQDSVWLVLAIFFESTVVAWYTSALSFLFRSHMSFMTLRALDVLPEFVRFGLAILVADFLAWLQHWIKHKVPWFWQIHAVHHSQSQLNLFTDLRFHLFEYLISRPIVMLPLFILSIKTPDIVLWTLFTKWFTRFYHANIKTDLGLLRYVLVTPQSHRLHHSIKRRHADQNFGVLFSFWDRLFRTQHPDHTVYPPTGINDMDFPLEKGGSVWAFLFTPVRQHLYPFRVIARGLIRTGK